MCQTLCSTNNTHVAVQQTTPDVDQPVLAANTTSTDEADSASATGMKFLALRPYADNSSTWALKS